jgi:hypothetical protein
LLPDFSGIGSAGNFEYACKIHGADYILILQCFTVSSMSMGA